MNLSKKYCVVPLCKSTPRKTPEKLFIYVPKDPKIRKKWTNAMRRAHPLGPKTISYCCEDHFDVEKDMENYVKHKLVGGPLKIKKDVLPHKFACQNRPIHNPERVLLSKLIAKSSRKEVWCKKKTEDSNVPSSASSSVKQYKRKPRKTKELAPETVKNETISVETLEGKQLLEQKKTKESFLDFDDNKTVSVKSLEGNQSSEQMNTMESFLDSDDNERMLVNSEGKQLSEQKKTKELFLDLEDNKTVSVKSLEGNQSSEQMNTMESFLDSDDNERMSVNSEGKQLSEQKKTKELSLDLGDIKTISVKTLEGNQSSEQMNTLESFLDSDDNERMSVNPLKGNQSSEQMNTLESFLDSDDNERMSVNPLKGNQSSEQMNTMESFLDSDDNERKSVNPLEGPTMSTEDWNIERHLCRCCHSEGTFKSLTSVSSMETDGTYSEILSYSLGIELCQVSEPLSAATYSICEVCIARLRDAHSFKSQVLKCEEHFQNMYKNNCIKVARADVEIKEELPDCDEPEFGFINGDEYIATFTFNEEDKKTRSSSPSDIVPLYELVGDTVKCLRCNKISTNMDTFNNHFKSIKLGRFKCKHCCARFCSKVPLTKHKLKKHSIDDRRKCNACEKYFNSHTGFKIHMEGYHKLGEKISCPQCDFECFTQLSFKRHMVSHNALRTFQCKFCKKSFKRVSNLNIHEKIHTGKRTSVCKECGQAFVQKASLNHHMVKHHPGVKF